MRYVQGLKKVPWTGRFAQTMIAQRQAIVPLAKRRVIAVISARLIPDIWRLPPPFSTAGFSRPSSRCSFGGAGAKSRREISACLCSPLGESTASLAKSVRGQLLFRGETLFRIMRNLIALIALALHKARTRTGGNDDHDGDLPLSRL